MHGIQMNVLSFIVPLKPWQNSDMRGTNIDTLGVASMCCVWPGEKKQKKKKKHIYMSSCVSLPKPYQEFSGLELGVFDVLCQEVTSRFITLENL